MNFSSNLRREDSGRFVTLLAAVGVLMSLMVIYAQPALAHHPESAASSICDEETGDTTLTLTSTSWTLSADAFGNHDTVKIQASTDGSDGSWSDVTTGAYAEPSRSFNIVLSGTDAIAGTTVEDLEGTTLHVKSQVIDLDGPGAGWYIWDPVGNSTGEKNYNTGAGTGNEDKRNDTSIAIPECDPPETPPPTTPPPTTPPPPAIEVAFECDDASKFVVSASNVGTVDVLVGIVWDSDSDSDDLKPGEVLSAVVPAGENWTIFEENVPVDQGRADTCDEVSPTSITATTTPEVSPETLPFTGAESSTSAALALVLVAGGALALVGARSFRAETDE